MSAYVTHRRRQQHRRATRSRRGASPKSGNRHRLPASRLRNWHPQLELFSAAKSPEPLLNLAVKLPNSCGQCGDLGAIVGSGNDTHPAGLLCRSCGLHRGWISPVNHAFLNELINKFGTPIEPIVFRTRSTKPEPNDDGVSVVQDGMRRE
jgi:hypothetical protein